MSKAGRGDRIKNNRIKILIAELHEEGMPVSAIAKELQHSYKHTNQIVEQIESEPPTKDQ